MSASSAVPRFGGFNTTVLSLEIRRVLRNRRTIVFILAFPSSFFLLFGLPYRGQHPGDQNFLAYVMISMAVYGAMIGSTTCGAAVAVERGQGWNRQLRLVPLHPVAYIAMKVVTAMVLGSIAISVEYLLGALSGVRMPAHAWLFSAGAAWLGSLLFAAAGLFVGFMLPSENVMQVIGPLLALLATFGGLFVPISFLPGALRAIAKVTPVYGVGVIARSPLIGGLTAAVFGNVVLWTAFFVCGAIWLFRRDTAK